MTAQTYTIGAVSETLPTAIHNGTIGSGESLTGQQGSATSYTTLESTASWVRNIYAGTADDFHFIELITPATLDRSVRTPFVLCFHQATGDETVILAGNNQPSAATSWTKLLDAWLDLGYAVVSLRCGNASGGASDQWANQAFRSVTPDILSYLEGQFRIHKNGVLLCGASMGAASAINFAVQARINKRKVAGFAFIDGAFSTRDMYAQTGGFSSPSITTGIQTAFALGATDLDGNGSTPATAGDHQWVKHVDTDTGQTGSYGALPGHDPLTMHLYDLDPSVPLYFQSIAGDGVVGQSLNTTAFVTRLTNEIGWTGPITQVNRNGGHVSTNHFDPASLNPVFAEALL